MCPTLCNPTDGSPPGSPVPGILQARITGVGCHFLLRCVKVKSESKVAQSCPTLSDPMDCSLPGSSAMGFSRQEYWSGVPLPSPRCKLVTYNKIHFSDGNTSVGFSIFIELYNHYYYLILEYFHYSEETVYPLAVTPHTRPHPLKPVIYFMSFWISLFYTFYVSGTVLAQADITNTIVQVLA